MIEPLAIPLGTRLIHIERVVKVTPAKWMTAEYAEISWRVWTALSSTEIGAEQKHGTFFQLNDDGSAHRIIDDDPNYADDVVMPHLWHDKQEIL